MGASAVVASVVAAVVGMEATALIGGILIRRQQPDHQHSERRSAPQAQRSFTYIRR
ncbi:MAG: hypothetical protein ACLUD2_20485 [Clostridium sp.]